MTTERRAFPFARALSRLAVRPLELLGLAAVLLVSAVLDFFRLGQEGYPNTYYAAAVKSMLQSWHNFFFVSFDPGGFVSVDKPPLGFWIQTASAKVFGFHGWSLLLPEALAGVLSVAVLFLMVRRAFGPLAGLLAALGLALTPVAVATNRNNTIDSLLVLTVLLAAWAVLRAVESGRLRWLLLGMALVGLGFNIKTLQAYLVLPTLVLLYLVAAPHGWWKRVAHLAAASVVLLAVSFAWIVAVDLTPAGQRPYVGSSQHNSELELALGYNGLQRLLGRDAPGPGARATQADDATRVQDGSGATAPLPADDGGDAARVILPPGGPQGGGPGGTGENGTAGLLRLLNTQLGGQASWLLGLSILGAVVAAWQIGLRPGSPGWQGVLLWGAWLLPAAAFFSVANYFHRYYLVMLAPPIAALAGIGLVALWRASRRGGWQAWLLPAALLATAALQAYLLRPYPAWSGWLTPLIAGLCVAAAAALVVIRLPLPVRVPATIRGGALALGIAAVFIAPGVWAAQTARQNGGGLPAGGPSATAGFGRPDIRADGTRAGVPIDGGQGAVPAGSDAIPNGLPADGFGAVPAGMPFGGLEQGIDAAMLSYLQSQRDGYKFLLATNSQQTTASIILQTGEPVMAMGGFLGSDPILTPEDLARDVANGTVRYFLIGGGFGGQNDALTSWIRANATPVPASAWGGSTTGAAGGFGGRLYEFTGAGSGS